MRLSLAGLWQISPLTNLSIPQNDLLFPAPLSQALPNDLSEQEIAEQEWHLMHDIEVDDLMLAYPLIELIIAGIEHYAEVRVNGVAVFDCDGQELVYRKDIRPYLQLGRNRFEILFIEEDEPLLLEEDRLVTCALNQPIVKQHDQRLGIWAKPYLQFIRHVRIAHITTEQIWHHAGGCELKVVLYYQALVAGLVSAAIKFNGMTYTLPIDIRSDHVSALFQIEAPKYADLNSLDFNDLYLLEVDVDGQSESINIALSESLCVTHFPT
ncbi:beta-galactosidase [Vibrio sp. 10N.286.49.B3]|uniref:glycosyl hydrolase 2 galactose-binding domain-containing protein n=1 Tax=Vibrio sp. 10N.286.49.B3 TaxID=1880855 RepID=UPI000C8290FE|nr:hypothetical protein [Vibrio sp. 10N.286.49.B3]PMH42518.1 beta-galactosidase [Vibrio sp. 10N.286.49.B3]